MASLLEHGFALLGRSFQAEVTEKHDFTGTTILLAGLTIVRLGFGWSGQEAQPGTDRTVFLVGRQPPGSFVARKLSFEL
jgi:hypothetical protein